MNRDVSTERSITTVKATLDVVPNYLCSISER